MTDKPSIVAALSAVMTEVQSVRKGDRNTQQGYVFRGIDAVVNAVGPAFRNHGIVAVPLVEDVAYATVEVGKQRTLMRECTVRVRYVFHGPAGDSIECVSIGEAMDSGDKATPKAMSVAFRVALLQALCIPTDEPDADSQSYERAAPADQVEFDPETQSFYDGFANEIGKAKSAAEIKTIGRNVNAARTKGELTRVAYDRLDVLAGRRLGELAQREGTDERTGDSDGGSPAPDPAGEGSGPDGQRAPIGGPGGDGETGGVRPGVQSGVHRGSGVDRSAQAPRDRGDAPAAAGGGRG